MSVWFTADTHFGHRSILKYTDRPVSDIDQMDRWIAERWNSVVRPEDVVYHLGDFSFRRRSETEDIFRLLNGRKHLIVGNHDGKATLRLPWESVNDLATVKLDTPAGRFEAVLCHYPMLTWNKAHYGRLHLHGHSHGNIAQSSTRFDVGWDAVGTWLAWSWAPVAADRIVMHVADHGITYDAVDHHVSTHQIIEGGERND